MPNTPRLRSALWLPLFDELSDPVVVARIAAEAEEAGWHGLFVWDHLSWRAPVRAVADPWITLAAAATVTERLQIGPMVTPLPRRRPTKVARETATLDRLSDGRLVLGVGLGSDRFGREYSATGEELDERRRAAMLDESLQVLDAAWSGQPVRHRGEHYVVDDLTFLPRPVVPCRSGSPGSPGSSGRCGGPLPSTATSRSTSSVPTNSPRRPRRSPSCAPTGPRRSTWPWPDRRARTSRPSPTRARPGG